MEVATTTTEAHLSAIHQSLLQISATLGRMLTYGCVNATSSPDAVVPAKCSTVGLNPNIGAVEVVDSSQQSGIVSTVNPGLVGAPPSSTMQQFGILKSGKHMPTRCSTLGLAVDTDVQLSAFTREATPRASLTDVVLNGELKLEVEPFSKEDDDTVMTHIGGMSLFLELDLSQPVLASITVYFPNLMIHLRVWEDGKSTILALELYVQWDPGIIQWSLVDNLKLDVTSKVKCLLLLTMGWYVAYIFLDNYAVAFTNFSRTDIKICNNSASCENEASVGIKQQAEHETVLHLFVTAQLQNIAQVGMYHIQKFEPLEALQRACSRYSIAASSFPWDPVIKEALMNGLFGLQLHAETCSSQCNFCGISISRKDAKAMQLATDYLLDKMPAWGRGGFSPGHNEQPNVGILPSWQHGGFSSDHGLLVLVSMNGTWVFYSQLWTKGSHGDFSVTVNNALFSVTSNREVNPCSLHIILAKFEKCSVEQLAFCKCLLNVAKAAMRILLTLALKDASCVIRKLLRLLVSFMDMTQNLYLGNSIPSFGVNFHYAVRLPGYLMLRYRCSIFDLWKCTSNHIVQVKKGNAAVPQVLIKCKGVPATSATWEDLHVRRARFPAAVAWGQASFPGGKDVTAGAVHEEESVK